MDAQLVKQYGADPKEDARRYSPAACLGAEKVEIMDAQPRKKAGRNPRAQAVS